MPGLAPGSFLNLTACPDLGSGLAAFCRGERLPVAGLIKYTKFSLFVDNTLIAEQQNVEATHSGGFQEVNTTEKGLSGFSPGSAKMTLKIDSAVPRAGYELDYLKHVYNGNILDVVFFRAGKKVKSKGLIMDLTEGQGTDKAASASFNMVCSVPEESTL